MKNNLFNSTHHSQSSASHDQSSASRLQSSASHAQSSTSHLQSSASHAQSSTCHPRAGGDPSLYLDYAATTPVDSRVAEVMMRYLTREGHFANPASNHQLGHIAMKAVEVAREQVAELVHCAANEIIWTSGATESNNLALLGAAQLYQRKGKHIVTVKTEHPAVLECCQQLEKKGYTVTYLPVQSNGLLDFDQLKTSLRADTILVSVMHVNNETGVIQDIARISELTAAQGILCHVDAAQSAGKIKVDLKKWPVDLMSFSAHKVYGPKGIGALYVRRKPRVRVAPLIFGGGQEQGMRSGTLPTHQIAGMGEAFKLANETLSQEYERIKALRDELCQSISISPRVFFNTDFAHTVPHIVNVGFKEMKAKDILQAMPDIALSVGSACQSKGIEPSYVLRAMGLTAEAAHSSLRISLGRWTTIAEITILKEKLFHLLK